MHPTKPEFTKREAAEECGVSTKTIERRLKPARKAKGKHGEESYYLRADVFKLRDALGYTKPEPPTQALTPDSYDTAPDTQDRQLTTAKSQAALVAFVQSMAASADPWPEWLTKAEALERSGIPPSFFREVPHIGHGRAVRYHRDDVRALSRRLRQEQQEAAAAIAALTEGAAPQGAGQASDET